MRKIIIAVVIIIVAVGGAFAFLGRKTDAPANTQATTDTTSNVEPVEASSDAKVAAVITYNDGFSPADITVKSGETVEIKNASSHVLDFHSDPHPAHTDDNDLNVGAIGAGQSKKFTLNKKGTWGYHNHLMATETGKVTVE